MLAQCRPLTLREASLVAFAFAFVAFPLSAASLQDASELFALLAESLLMGRLNLKGGSADAPLAGLMASAGLRVEEGLRATQNEDP